MSQEYRVLMCAQSVKQEVIRGTQKECEDFMELYNGEIVDENQFVWDLEIEEL